MTLLMCGGVAATRAEGVAHPRDTQGRQGAGRRLNPPPVDPANRPQPDQGRAGGAGAKDNISPADVQSMFEAMTLLEADRFVMLTADQMPMFVPRLRRLQEARAQHFRRHNRAIAELRVMANPQTGKADDATIDAKLKELDTIEAESLAAVNKAMEAIDQLLSPRQRARFRLLEENIEKKKLDFLTKVRQTGRGGGQ
jgi:hypothetical protein